MDEATAGNGEIDSVEQAIIANTDVVAGVDLVTGGVARFHAYGASCVLTDATGPGGSAKSWLVVAGGLEEDGDMSDAIDAYDGNSWVRVTTSADVAFQLAAFKVDPSNAARCIIAGGEDAAGTTKTNKIRSLTLDHDGSGNPTIAVANAGVLNADLSKLTVENCDSKLLFIGGQDEAPDPVNSLQVWDTSFLGGTSTIPALKDTNNDVITLNTERFDHASLRSSDVDSTRDGIIVAGGDNGNPLADIELIKTNGSCALFDNPASNKPVTFTTGSGNARLGGASGATPRTQLFGVLVSNEYVFAGGHNVGAASRDETSFAINWSTMAVTGTRTANAMVTGVASPSVVQLDADQWVIVSGTNGDRLSTAAIATMQEFHPTSTRWTATTTDSASAALPAMAGAFVGLLNGDIIAGSGYAGTLSTAASTTFDNEVYVIH